MQAADARIQSVQNPVADIPAGLNLAIRHSSHPVIVRVDAHTQLPPGYTRRAVETLLRTGAANVGGVMAAVGRPGFQAAVARAYNSRFGLGGGAYHSADQPAGPAESAFLGVMRAEVLKEVGYYDTTLRRGEDWELNHRIIAAGHLVWMDPQLQVNYWPRSSLSALWRQFYATGIWRGELVRRLHLKNSPRYFAPPVLVMATAVAAVAVPVAATVSVGGGAGTALAVVAVAAGLGPVAYLAALAGVGSFSSGSPRERLRFCVVLATMHYAWGAGFLLGTALGAGDTVDTSRIDTVHHDGSDPDALGEVSG
jgi:hypothetical protein